MAPGKSLIYHFSSFLLILMVWSGQLAGVANTTSLLDSDIETISVNQYFQSRQPIQGQSEIPQQLPMEVKEFEENTDPKPRETSPAAIIQANDASNTRLRGLIYQDTYRFHFKEPGVALYILFHAWRSFIK